MAKAILELLQAHQPATFEERGVSVPFTTPRLAGARVRFGDRGRLELVLPNPSGGRGVYVVVWENMRRLYQPTMHDLLLSKRIGMLETVRPDTIRIAARDIARKGLAGKEAIVAAEAAEETEKQDRRHTRSHIIKSLMRQVAADEVERSSSVWDAKADEIWQNNLPNLSRSLGVPPAMAHQAMEELSYALSGTGIVEPDLPARLPLAIEALIELRNETAHWARSNADSSMILAATISCFAEATISLAEAALVDLRQLLEEPLRLFYGWIKARPELSRRMIRPDWLLDGWPQVCALWQMADSPNAYRMRLEEMVYIVPPLPSELIRNHPFSNDFESLLRQERTDPANESGRAHTPVLDLIARNESVRAACLRTECPVALAA